MRVPAKHLLRQGAVIGATGRLAMAALAQRIEGGTTAPPEPPTTPGPEHTAVVPPRSPELVRDLVRWSGGEPRAYRGTLPPYLFPQWTYPVAMRTLEGLSYPLSRVLNAGCRLEIRRPIPADRKLHVRARLDDVDDDGRRAILNQHVVTGPEDDPEAMAIDYQVLVPLGGGGDGKKKKDDKPRVPREARELSRARLSARAGLEFALLTGDFNPIHWLKPAARASGFPHCILHGFGTLARAVEAMNRGLWAGDPFRLGELEVRFTRPLVLPAEVGAYVAPDGDAAPSGTTGGSGHVWVGDAPAGPAYMTGTWAERRKGSTSAGTKKGRSR